MSYTSITNDGFNMKRNIDNQSLISDPELKQGQALLRRRSKMKKSVRVRSKELMKEGFANIQGSNFQQAVVKQNNDEIQALIGMQQSFDHSMHKWQKQKDRVITDIKNKPQEYQDCVESCRKNKADDALNACLYGCGIGKFASSSTTYRGNKPPPITIWQLLGEGLIDIAELYVDAYAIGVAVGAAAGAIGLFIITLPYSGLVAYAVRHDSVMTAIAISGIENEDKTELAANAISNSLKKLKEQKKPQSPGDVITSMVFMGYLNGKTAGDKAMAKAAISLKQSKYANINPDSLTSDYLKTMQLQENMNALEFYEELIAKFNFFEPFDDLSPLEKLYFLFLLAQTKQGANHMASTSPINGDKNSSHGLDYYKSHKKEGFENNLQPYSVGSVTDDGEIITKRGEFLGFETDPARMGSYGPVGWLNRDAKGGKPVGPGTEIVNESDLKIRNTINKLLGSNPLAKTTMTDIDGFLDKNIENFSGSVEQANTLAQMKAVNPNGLRTLVASSSNTFKKIYDGLANDSLVKKMKGLNVSPEEVDKNLKKLEKQWAKIFKSGCAMGITDPNYVPGSRVSAKHTFSGHKQYCQGFTNTKNGRSGYFGQEYIVGQDGKRVVDGLFDGNSLIGTTQNLNNQANVGTPADNKAGRRGCDIEIKPEQSGFCVCVDGTKVYMDAGHPSVSCNDLCYPKNITNSGTDQIFYNNPDSWKPGTYPAGGISKGIKAFNQTSVTEKTPWLQCGSGGPGFGPDPCPNGMVQSGEVGPEKNCGQYDADTGFLGIHWPWQKKEMKTNLGRKCVVPLPPGGEFPKTELKTVGNGMGLQIPKGYTKLPSPSELVDECKSAPYDNLYVQILKFKVLDEILNAKTKVMSDVVSQTNKGQLATKMQQSAVGRKLLRDMQKYKRLYEKFEKDKKMKNNLEGIYEDVNFKSQSANISYYIWFILAISGMFLVIKKLKSSN
jgi:hypothetical protein